MLYFYGYPVQLDIRSDKADRLLAAPAIHDLDLVLADSPAPARPTPHMRQ